MKKTGIFNWFGYVQPFEERIELIKRAGYDYVMLWWEDETYPRHIDKRRLITIVNEYSLKPENVHLPFEDTNLLWSEDKCRRDIHSSKIIKQLSECKNSGAETIVMHTVHGANMTLDYSSGYDSFSKIVKAAEELNLRLAFENTQMFNYTDFLLKEFESPYIGFCYDSSHDFVNGQSCGAILEKWSHKLFSVHLSDNDGICDRHWIPGKGNVNWSKIIDIIETTECKSFSMEAYPYEDEKNLAPYEFLLKARQHLLQKLNG